MDKKIIIIGPWARALRNGGNNAKNYPRWTEVVNLLKAEGYHIIQVGVDGEKGIGADEVKNNLSMEELELLVNNSFTIIGVDSYINHLAWYLNKRGVFLWGKSDPAIFGHPENVNLFKDRKYFRTDVFRWWEDVQPLSPELWVSPQEVVDAVRHL